MTITGHILEIGIQNYIWGDAEFNSLSNRDRIKSIAQIFEELFWKNRIFDMGAPLLYRLQPFNSSLARKSNSAVS